MERCDRSQNLKMRDLAKSDLLVGKGSILDFALLKLKICKWMWGDEMQYIKITENEES